MHEVATLVSIIFICIFPPLIFIGRKCRHENTHLNSTRNVMNKFQTKMLDKFVSFYFHKNETFTKLVLHKSLLNVFHWFLCVRKSLRSCLFNIAQCVLLWLIIFVVFKEHNWTMHALYFENCKLNRTRINQRFYYILKFTVKVFFYNRRK